MADFAVFEYFAQYETKNDVKNKSNGNTDAERCQEIAFCCFTSKIRINSEETYAE